MRLRADARPFLRKTLATLSALAGDATGAKAAAIVNRIHARWHADKGYTCVTLSASDGHRACRVTLPGDGAPANVSTTFHLACDDSPARKVECEEIRFDIEQGKVWIAAGNLAWPLEPPNSADAQTYPSQELTDLFTSANALRDTAASRVELNPNYLADGLAIFTGFWDKLPDTLVAKNKPRFDFITGGKHDPILLVTELPTTAPPFRIEYLLMPYCTP